MGSHSLVISQKVMCFTCHFVVHTCWRVSRALTISIGDSPLFKMMEPLKNSCLAYFCIFRCNFYQSICLGQYLSNTL